MTDYTGNSIKNREGKEDEKKEIKKVVKGKASVKKQSELKKIANNIIVEEAKSIILVSSSSIKSIFNSA